MDAVAGILVFFTGAAISCILTQLAMLPTLYRIVKNKAGRHFVQWRSRPLWWNEMSGQDTTGHASMEEAEKWLRERLQRIAVRENGSDVVKEFDADELTR